MSEALRPRNDTGTLILVVDGRPCNQKGTVSHTPLPSLYSFIKEYFLAFVIPNSHFGLLSSFLQREVAGKYMFRRFHGEILRKVLQALTLITRANFD